MRKDIGNWDEGENRIGRWKRREEKEGRGEEEGWEERQIGKRRIGRGIEEENRTEDRSEEWKSISKYM